MSDCNFPLCTRIAQKNGLCIGHRIYQNEFPSAIIKEEMKQQTKKAPIKNVSDKRKVLNVELAKIVKRIKKDRPVCEMKVPGVCSGKTVTAHHSKGKVGALLLDEKYLIASCSPCNLWEVAHPKEAKEMGISRSRLKI